MPRDKLRRDLNETALDIVRAATGQGAKPKRPGKGEPNALAAARGRLGGLRGGPARKAKVSKTKLSQIGRKGAAARWKVPPKS